MSYSAAVTPESIPQDVRDTRDLLVPSRITNPLALLPGLLLLAAVGYAGKWIERTLNTWAKVHHYTFPNIEYVLWAVLLGLVIGNTIGVPRIFRAGVATYEFWLKAGIILLGARFVLGDVLKLGGISLGLVLVALTGSIAFMLWLGSRFGLGPRLSTLLAVGSGICGVSAIIATQGSIDADDEEVATAIAAILALGAVSLFAFPLIGHSLHMSDHAYGLWTGLAVDNTAEATAAGALYSDAAGKYAVLAKTCRNALIGFVVLGTSIVWARRGLASAQTQQNLGNKALFLWRKFPKFVLGFLFISALATLGAAKSPALAQFGFNKAQLASLGNLSRWAFLLTFAGVGLRTDLRALFRQGARPFVVSALGEVAIAVITLVLILGVDRVVHL